MTRKQHGGNVPVPSGASPGYRGIGYGLASPVVVAQMEGQSLPHVERQAGDHWDMHRRFDIAPGAPE